jgi:trigger factor
LPELDDEFAKDLGEQFESLDDLRQHLQKQLKQRWETLSGQQLRSSLTEELIKSNSLELPDRMVDNYVRNLQRERAEREGGDHHHHDHDHDHDHHHGDDDEERATASAEERTNAIRQLKSYLLIEAVRESAGVVVADEEFEAYLSTRARDSGMKVGELRRSKWADSLRKELEETKVFDYLIERAEIEEQSI